MQCTHDTIVCQEFQFQLTNLTNRLQYESVGNDLVLEHWLLYNPQIAFNVLAEV